MTTKTDLLWEKTKALKLYGVLAHWEDVAQCPWLPPLLQWEEEERAQRSLERRLTSARLGRFKPISEFDWAWPKKCDRQAIEEWLRLAFIKQATNLILCGPNGVGKSTIARNIAYQAVIQGYTALFITAGEMLNDLAAQDGDQALRRRIKRYVQPQLLIADEVGYLSYSNRHADLFFEIIARRYEEKPTIVTTNKPFTQWSEIFPNAACVVSLIDRLVHHSEIISIEAESFRLKEAKEQNNNRKLSRQTQKTKENTEKK